MPDDGKPLSRRRFLRRVAVVAGVVVVGLGLESAREAFAFTVRRERRALPGLTRPLRAAVLTDLHIGPYLHERHLAAWVRAAAAVRPDVALLVGDLVDEGYRGDLSEFRRWLPELRPPLGAYVVPGNHDRVRYPDLTPWSAMLAEVDYKVLLNQGLRVRDDLYLAGVDDLREGRPDPARALAGATAEARVMMSHNPDLIPELSAAAGTAPDLLLCGHTHGGQICLPGIGPIVTGSDYGRRYVAGWVQADFPAFVSRGLGVTLVPLRFDCPAELVVMDLTPT